MGDFSMAIIDGTGPYDDASYDTEMQNSFCNQLGRALGPDGRYERGPSDDGYRMRERGARAASFLAGQRTGGASRLMLAGYSRGGSAAIMAAEILQSQKIDVAALFLFDPVARHLSKGGEVVPANVQFVRVARRKLDPEMVEKYDHTIGPLWHSMFHNPMRVFFGTTGIQYSGTGDCQSAEFRGSHGAMGGVGWAHVTEDHECQLQVADFMNSALSDVKVAVRLRGFPPTNTP